MWRGWEMQTTLWRRHTGRAPSTPRRRPHQDPPRACVALRRADFCGCLRPSSKQECAPEARVVEREGTEDMWEGKDPLAGGDVEQGSFAGLQPGDVRLRGLAFPVLVRAEK